MTVNQANLVNAKANTFKFFEVDFDISAMNADSFELAA